LEIAGAASSTKNGDLIATGADEINWSFGDDQAVFIYPWSDKNLIGRFRLFQGFAGERKALRVGWIHN